MKILVFGNPLVEEDNLPLKICRRLQNIPGMEFKEVDPEDLPVEGRDLIILDTVKGIEDVTLITDIDSIITEKVYSLHDFDLGYYIKLMKKLGMIDSVRVIGIPVGMREEEAAGKVSEITKSLMDKNR